MKKTMLILVSVALVLILLTLGLLWWLISGLAGRKASGYAPDSVAEYIAEKWTFYRLRSWDPDRRSLELEYPQELTYDQFARYGAELGFTEAALDQTEQMRNLCRGMQERLGLQPETVTVYGISADGREVYSVDLDGTLTACWETEPEQP